MAVELTSCNFSISGEATLTETGLVIHTPSDPVQIGTGSFGALSWSLDNGDGVGQANQMVVEQITIPAGTAVNLALCDGSLENFRGQPVVFSAIKLAIIAVAEPDGVKRVFVGPQGEPDGAQLWFPGTGADAAEEVLQAAIHPHPDAGWLVSATSGDLLQISNPDDATAGLPDVIVNVILIGVE